MTAQTKPFSPETLAERWGCSAQKVRTMYHDGEIAGFKLGKLIRIPATEVERYECQITASPCTEESLPSPFEREEAAFASRLVRQTVALPKLAPVRSGRAEPTHQANG